MRNDLTPSVPVPVHYPTIRVDEVDIFYDEAGTDTSPSASLISITTTPATGSGPAEAKIGSLTNRV
jgi:hypothetical protein